MNSSKHLPNIVIVIAVSAAAAAAYAQSLQLFPIHFPVTFSCECTSLLIFGMV
jgi:hypothetical protein